ncbi:hypothetical protein HNP47_003003 [Brevundimonas vesicularis]|uniref:Uncharacterized protein n=1 Tax=Brevundimonas vesicularis TaxID=41276 RepID=A0A7W9FWS6_BREVE|nr:hypothetical protein [Brevundimonas vesicularis]MBB5772983.1 hypothetical protein [Brevundimonas vesicularis]
MLLDVFGGVAEAFGDQLVLEAQFRQLLETLGLLDRVQLATQQVLGDGGEAGFLGVAVQQAGQDRLFGFPVAVVDRLADGAPAAF